MSALLVVFSTLTLAHVPGGWLLAQQLTVAGTASHLPVASLVRTANRLWTCYHDDDSVPVVRFVPRSRASTDPERDQERADREAGGQEGQAGRMGETNGGARPVGPCGLTEEQSPAIVLYRPYYVPQGRSQAIQDLPVDTASALYAALIRAGAAGGANGQGSDAEEWAARAQTTMTDVPLAQQQAVFREAAIDFLAHALSVAHEIGRHERRRRARGATLCGFFDRPDSLFGAWTTVFGAGHYGGLYHDGTAWVASRSGLTVDDRQWLVESVLSSSWTGDAEHDFAWICDESPPS